MKKTISIIFLSAIISITNAFAEMHDLKPELVNTIVTPYLHIQESLADDDFEQSKKAAVKLLKILNMHKMPQLQSLTDAGNAIDQAGDIKEVRSAFHDLSKSLLILLENTGSSHKSLFIAHCPMAFNNTGAFWIQTDENINNPYWGAMMLHCGSIQKQIGTKDHGHNAHSGHKH